MAYNYEYPYTDTSRVNSDWIIKRIIELSKEYEEFIVKNQIKYANPIEWNITKQYEQNTVVINPENGDAYLSVKPVPNGVLLTNTDYWTPIFNYDLAVSLLRKQLSVHDEGNSHTATSDRNIEDWVFIEGKLYKVIAPMIAGDTYIEGSNIQKITVHDYIIEESTQRKEKDTEIEGEITDINATLDNHEERLEKLELGKFSSVVMIGDSFLQGYTPSGHVKSWGEWLEDYITETNPDALIEIQAEGGAGYRAVGQSGHTFTNLVDIAYASVTEPDKVSDVIMIGGINDCDGGLEIDPTATIENIKSKFPNAKIYVGMNPVVAAYRQTYNSALLMPYSDSMVDMICESQGWLYGLGDISEDSLHPDADAQEKIGNCLWKYLNGESTYYVDSSVYTFTENGADLTCSIMHSGNEISLYLKGTVPAGPYKVTICEKEDMPQIFKYLEHDIGIPVTCFDETGSVVGAQCLLYTAGWSALASDGLWWYYPLDCDDPLFVNYRVTFSIGALS